MAEGRRNRPVPSREDKPMSALPTHEATEARTTGTVATADRRGLRGALHRIRRTIQEMNYASRRVVEVQAPWSVDEHWHRR
jgi:hypothetical protein